MNECFICYMSQCSYVRLNVKGVGDEYFPICSRHINGVFSWHELNTVLEKMGVKSKIIKISDVKYAKQNR